MKNHLITGKRLLVLALALAATAAVLPAMAAEQSVHLRGTIASVMADNLVVQTAQGSRTVTLDAATKTIGVVPSSLDQIKDGTFIGTANVKRQGHATALEMVVFPESMKGMGLGDYGWDLAPGGGSSSMTNGSVTSSMTNGTVKSASRGGSMAMHSSMTNGTVKKTSDSNGLTLLVDYGKGEKSIRVPSDVPVVTFQKAGTDALVKGAHVFVVANAGAPMKAALVAVGLNGTVPPM